ncbi:MAG: tRNA pseudouridine(38-40) synthase TruA [Acidobacteria bacterium]|nr:tRNA pseudouridine(38-40) synthase TruA [Acidobacteriota bacterium]
MRLKLTIEYAGTRYSGWQIQNNARTVQGEIDRAIREVTRASTFELYGSGRTDAGVHALAQIAHLELPGSAGQRWPTETLRRRINDALPFDINLLRIERARPKFHARHDAVARSYLYQIARRRTAFAKPFVWWVKEPLDDGAMRRAAARFVGTHDFRFFSDDDPAAKSTRVHLEVFGVHDHGDVLLVHIEGSHFLWKMVRRLVGVLVEVGRGGLTADHAAALLLEPSPVPARLTAPAAGLFLDRVYYPGEARDTPAEPPVFLRPVR